jgi:hypothetical protein
MSLHGAISLGSGPHRASMPQPTGAGGGLAGAHRMPMHAGGGGGPHRPSRGLHAGGGGGEGGQRSSHVSSIAGGVAQSSSHVSSIAGANSPVVKCAETPGQSKSTRTSGAVLVESGPSNFECPPERLVPVFSFRSGF